MKPLLIVLGFFLFYSCIPLRIAPTIKEDKVMVAKKFKRHLPRNYAFIFEDRKDADEFYHFINTKYALDHLDVEWNVPITIDDEEVFLSFYEVEIPTKTINLIPIFIDVALNESGIGPILENEEFSRTGHWYLALTVSDVNLEDCLGPHHKHKKKVVEYLRELRSEYLRTSNYIEALLRN